MSKFKINIDLDDVLNDLTTHWEATHHQRTGEKISFTQWDVSELSIYGTAIFDYLREPFFFYEAPVKDTAIELFDYLSINTSIYSYKIVSACKDDEDSDVFKAVKAEKYMWLGEKFGSDVADKLILTNKSKKNYPADVVIDDYYKNLIESKKGSIKLLYNSRHNANVSLRELRSLCDGGVVKRVSNHRDIIEELEALKFYGSIENYIKKSIV
jgi:5'(3')-deoxyribonucleotidase